MTPKQASLEIAKTLDLLARNASGLVEVPVLAWVREHRPDWLSEEGAP